MSWTSLAAVTVLAAVSVTVPSVPPSAAVTAPTIRWGACPPEQYAGTRDPRQECGTLRVPLDYGSPGGRSLDMHVSRIATAKPALRRGILVLDAGGPADVGLDYPSMALSRVPQDVLDRYDLIGFDPRGVGHSAPITCRLPMDLPLDLAQAFPAVDGSIARNVAVARRIAALCATHGGDVLPHITTPNTARDLDRLRAALGEQRISYLGYSYGTYLGAIYRTLFAQRVDRMVLDSAIDPAHYGYDQIRAMGLAVELRLPDFLRWAAARDDRYHLGSTQAAVRRTFETLVARYDANPLTLPDGVVINGNVVRILTLDGIFVDSRLPGLAETWQQLLAASTPADVRTALASAGTRHRVAAVADIPADNADSIRISIPCNDGVWPRDVATYRRNVALDRKLYPAMAGSFANIRPCAFWGAPAHPPVRVTGGGSRNVLIVQNLRDPATPWVGALGLQRALGSAAVLLSVDQGGHTAYLSTASSCANDTTTAYLAHGTLPGGPRLCAGQPLPS